MNIQSIATMSNPLSNRRIVIWTIVCIISRCFMRRWQISWYFVAALQARGITFVYSKVFSALKHSGTFLSSFSMCELFAFYWKPKERFLVERDREMIVTPSFVVSALYSLFQALWTCCKAELLRRSVLNKRANSSNQHTCGHSKHLVR